eukprot:GFYU01027515.1.p1 GENE.GFYU01027515.1~~GFYU01027515.1.p1  ORF type:complete len:160 (-),score=17.41 GFYU01027515.1:99-578(-)
MKVITSLAAMTRAKSANVLNLRRSEDLLCRNLMCAKVGEACVCRLSLVLEKIKHLDHLDLSDNQLKFLPESVWSIPGLKSLNISGNELTELQDGVTNLKDLRRLYVCHNELTQLPLASLSQLEALEEVHVKGNPMNISTLPPQQFSVVDNSSCSECDKE